MKNTIKLHKNFKFPENNWLTEGPLHLKWRPKLFESPQFGFVATKKTFPRAVDRNRAKRLLRIWIRANTLPKDLDLLFVARPSILEINYLDGAHLVKTVVKKITKTLPTDK